MTALLNSINYNEHKWKICGDLKVIAVPLGVQLGYTKYCCFLCMWDGRDRRSHHIKEDWPARNLKTDKKNLIAEPLVDPKDVLLPPLHIKLSLMKIFVKGTKIHPLCSPSQAAHNKYLDQPEISNITSKQNTF